MKRRQNFERKDFVIDVVHPTEVKGSGDGAEITTGNVGLIGDDEMHGRGSVTHEQHHPAGNGCIELVEVKPQAKRISSTEFTDISGKTSQTPMIGPRTGNEETTRPGRMGKHIKKNEAMTPRTKALQTSKHCSGSILRVMKGEILSAIFEYLRFRMLFHPRAGIAFTCKEWKDIASSTTFWKRRIATKYSIPAVDASILRATLLMEADNLLTNGDGSLGLDGWEKKGSVELEPRNAIGTSQCPANLRHVWVTSFQWGSLVQRLALPRENWDDNTHLVLEFWVSSRFDQSVVYDVALLILDSGEVLDEVRDRREIVSSSSWHFVTMTLNFHPEARQAAVVLRGKDTSYWSGNYGAKFGGVSLRICHKQQGRFESGLKTVSDVSELDGSAAFATISSILLS